MYKGLRRSFSEGERGSLPADRNAPNLLVCDDSCTPRERLPNSDDGLQQIVSRSRLLQTAIDSLKANQNSNL